MTMDGMVRTCTTCGQEKSLEDFWLHKRGKNGRRSKCNTCLNAYKKEYRSKDPEKWRTVGRKWSRNLRMEVLNEYGHRCSCCGETRYEFLAMDHVNGNGAYHRATVGEGTKIYMDIRRRGFPKDEFRILCHNCNQARGYYGYCPHEKEKQNGAEDKREIDAVPEGIASTCGIVLREIPFSRSGSSTGIEMVAVS